MSKAASRLPRAAESVLATETADATRRTQQPPTTRTTTNAIRAERRPEREPRKSVAHIRPPEIRERPAHIRVHAVGY